MLKIFKINYAKLLRLNGDYLLMLNAILLLIAVSVVIGWFSFKKEIALTEQPKFQIIGNVVLTIDFGNDKQRVFAGAIVKNENLVDVLTQTAKAGNFYYRLDEKINLVAIENFAATKNRLWHGYINGKEFSTPLNKIFLKNGDQILFKYL